MNKEQLDKIKEYLYRIKKMETILAMTWGVFRIDGNYKGSPSIIVNRSTLNPALENYICYLKAELKDLGYEE